MRCVGRVVEGRQKTYFQAMTLTGSQRDTRSIRRCHGVRTLTERPDASGVRHSLVFYRDARQTAGDVGLVRPAAGAKT